LQQLGQLAFLSLKVRVATNVFVVDENVWNRRLARDFLERSLNIGSVVWERTSQPIALLNILPRSYRTGLLANLIKLNHVELGALFGEKRFGGCAVWAVGLAEDSCNHPVSEWRAKLRRRAGVAYQRRCRQ
jgi:hypothetical protein